MKMHVFMNNKLLVIIFFLLGIAASHVGYSARLEPVVYKNVEPRIETINQYAFLVVALSKSTLKPAYGEKVELVFSNNKRVHLYNLSNKEIQFFTDSEGKFIAFITPENLRCFQNQTLKKVIIRQDGKKEVVKVSVPVDYIAQEK